MSERTDERTADGGDVDDVGLDDDELGVDVEALTGEPDAAANAGGGADAPAGGADASSGSLLDGLSRFRPSVGVPNPLAAIPSARSVGLSLGVVLLSMVLFSAFVPLGDVAVILGIAVGSFLLGIGSGKRRYLELGVAGAVSAAVWIVLGRIFLSAVANLAVPLAAIGAGSGLVAALLGHYFGRDLRSGLTRDVE